MAQRRFPVLVATDGSPQARTAVQLATVFPWPRGSSGHGIVARGMPILAEASAEVWDALRQVAETGASRAARQLRRRWPTAEVVVSDAPPVSAILAQARRLRAAVIVVGSRGLGAVGRLFLGSVSRACVRQATTSVLVAKGAARPPRRFVLGVDGSAHARRAVALVSTLTPPRGGEVRLLGVVEPVRLASTALMPARVRAVVESEATDLEKERVTAARRHLDAAQARLARAGWRVRVEVRSGRPVEEILDAAQGADVLVVGARGVGGVERLLVGSVAEGVVSRAQVPVLVVR